MWTCPRCDRIFEKDHQPHSCQKIPLEEHFKNKQSAKELFDFLFKIINEKIGVSQIISLPCCVHLFGHYDFIAILPHKNKLELRFLDSQRLKHCLDISTLNDINDELINRLSEAYHLKDKS